MRMSWGLAVNQNGLGNRVIFAVAGERHHMDRMNRMDGHGRQDSGVAGCVMSPDMAKKNSILNNLE